LITEEGALIRFFQASHPLSEVDSQDGGFPHHPHLIHAGMPISLYHEEMELSKGCIIISGFERRNGDWEVISERGEMKEELASKALAREKRGR